METAKGTRALAWIGSGLRALPLPIIDMALQRLVIRIIDRYPESFDRMSPYASTAFLIEPTDLPIQFCIRLDSSTPIVCQRHPVTCGWNARIAGPISSLLAMAHGALDGDALFFSREITIEGDTDAILAMRNAIDAAEIDLPYEIGGLFGPFSPAARHAMQIATPVMARLLNITSTSREYHAT
jgi:predicted lipid carrier protein YhbT